MRTQNDHYLDSFIKTMKELNPRTGDGVRIKATKDVCVCV